MFSLVLGPAGCNRSRHISTESDMDVKLAAINAAREAFGKAEPNWVQTRDCPTGNSDLYLCMAFVGAKMNEEQMARSGVSAGTVQAPKSLGDLTVDVVEVKLTGPKSGRATVSVAGQCNFSSPGYVAGKPFSCDPRQQPFRTEAAVDLAYGPVPGSQIAQWAGTVAGYGPPAPASAAPTTQMGQPGTAPSPPVPATDADSAFALLPDFSKNWEFVVGSGSPTVSYSGGQLLVRAPVSGSSGRLHYIHSPLTDDPDVTFDFKHEGFGRTSVGLWSVARNEWQVWADLDTNDTPCLYLNSWNQPGTSVCPSDRYLNRPLALRIQVAGNRVTFYVDNAAVGSFNYVNSGPCTPSMGAGSVNWKSGDNVTTFYGVHVTSGSPKAL